MPLVDPMTGTRVRPSMLRDNSDHLYAFDGESVDWVAKAGEIVMLVDRGQGANRVMFALEPSQLASMLMRAVGTQKHESLLELHLSHACRRYLAFKDATEGDE